jgi:hypothetical protein
MRSQRAGSSQKLSALTDFEYRVWDQYQLSADDFGIMPCEALQIQADNLALRAPRATAEDVQRALERLVDIGLVLCYEHQGRRYIVDPLWQHFQRVQYPKQTMNPAPTRAVLAHCHQWTQALFLQCFGKKSQKFSKPPENPGISENFLETPDPPKVSSTTEIRANTDGKGQTAKSAANESPQDAQAAGLILVKQTPTERQTTESRFDEFWRAYPKKVGKDDAKKSYSKRQPSAAIHAQMLAAIEQQKSSRQWQLEGGRFIPNPSTWLNQGRWQDEIAQATPETRGVISSVTAHNLQVRQNLLDRLAREGMAS